jgi:IMP dehydrogenase
MTKIHDGLTFDDVLMVPAASEVMPASVNVGSRLTKNITLNIPLVSAAMDTVTEAPLAIAIAQMGGIGVLHRNMEIDEQVEMVRQVKRYEAGMVVNPVTMHPDQTLRDALDLMASKKISGLPIVERGGDKSKGKLVGVLTNRDVRFAEKLDQTISELMTKDNLITVEEGVSSDEARKLLHHHRIEKLIVVDKAFNCIGLITVKDMEKSTTHPNAAKDGSGRLLVAAATTVGQKGYDRAKALHEAECDVIMVDTAHGHSKYVIESVKRIKKDFPDMELIAGNVATYDAAKALCEVGADGIKVGIGPGSICTTRIVAGVGVPQLTAILNVAEYCGPKNIPFIADGGIKTSGDIAKAIGAGASTVMVGSMLAGTQEAPGEVFLYQGRSYKAYRGMGSVGAMARGSADRYFQEDIKDALKLVPEGVEGQVPYKGPVSAILHQMVGGLRAAMGYTGKATVEDMRGNVDFVKITNAGLRESHVHDVTITRESPNYSGGGT